MNPKTVYTRNFWLVSLSSLLFSSSFNMLIPELPSYLSSLGGAEYIGLIIALFTITAGLSRPFSGKLTDTIGRKPVMLIGTSVCVICGLLYPVLNTVIGFLLLRLFHGFSTGFSPTAISTYVADIIPQKKWGEAMGIQGLLFGTGMALGPALGGLIKLHFSYHILFYSSSLMALLSVLLILNIGETLGFRQKFNAKSLRISRNEVIAKEAIPAAIVTFFYYIAFGVVLTLIPDWSTHLGIENKGTFFVYFTIASLLVRFVSGKASDQYGRVIIISIGLTVLIVALIIIGSTNTSQGLLAGASCYGLAMGILSPAVNAWTIDLSDSKHRGKSIATMYMALEAGIGLGAFFSGWYYQNQIDRFPYIMYTCAFMASIALLYIFKRNLSTKKASQ